jgi:hypothetical protein
MGEQASLAGLRHEHPGTVQFVAGRRRLDHPLQDVDDLARTQQRQNPGEGVGLRREGLISTRPSPHLARRRVVLARWPGGPPASATALGALAHGSQGTSGVQGGVDRLDQRSRCQTTTGTFSLGHVLAGVADLDRQLSDAQPCPVSVTAQLGRHLHLDPGAGVVPVRLWLGHRTSLFIRSQPTPVTTGPES